MIINCTVILKCTFVQLFKNSSLGGIITATISMCRNIYAVKMFLLLTLYCPEETEGHARGLVVRQGEGATGCCGPPWHDSILPQSQGCLWAERYWQHSSPIFRRHDPHHRPWRHTVPVGRTLPWRTQSAVNLWPVSIRRDTGLGHRSWLDGASGH